MHRKGHPFASTCCSVSLLTHGRLKTFLAGITTHPFGSINAVSVDNLFITQPCHFKPNLVFSLNIADEALPPKTWKGISMVVRVQLNRVGSIHSKKTSGSPLSFNISASTGNLNKSFIHGTPVTMHYLFQWKQSKSNGSKSDPNCKQQVTRSTSCS